MAPAVSKKAFSTSALPKVPAALSRLHGIARSLEQPPCYQVLQSVVCAQWAVGRSPRGECGRYRRTVDHRRRPLDDSDAPGELTVAVRNAVAVGPPWVMTSNPNPPSTSSSPEPPWERSSPTPPR
jgi:hypothetical protein